MSSHSEKQDIKDAIGDYKINEIRGTYYVKCRSRLGGWLSAGFKSKEQAERFAELDGFNNFKNKEVKELWKNRKSEL